jgi:phospholipid/cholesterol/gamma-HCH transport system permease protein
VITIENKTLGHFFQEVVVDLIYFARNWRISLGVIVSQVYFTGYQALSMVIPIAVMLGLVIIGVGHLLLKDVGQMSMLYKLLVSGLITDVAPVIISFIILLRSGSAITTELGYMKVNEEISSLRVAGISPISYIVSPRIIGAMFSSVLLSCYFSFFGIGVGYILSNLIFSLQFDDFLRGFIDCLTMKDILLMIIKVVLSSFLVTLICCYQGLRVSRSYTDVPRRVIKALTVSVGVILLVNIFITSVSLLI